MVLIVKLGWTCSVLDYKNCLKPKCYRYACSIGAQEVTATFSGVWNPD